MSERIKTELKAPVEATVEFEAEEKKPVVLPVDLMPYAESSDKFFSDLRQRVMAERRRMEAGKMPEGWKPPFIMAAKDLLILREKRENEGSGISIPFAVGAYSAEPGELYEITLAKALKSIDACLFTHTREGYLFGDFAQAHKLRAIGVELPPSLMHYDYITRSEPAFPSFWNDAEAYCHLWRQRKPPVDGEG